MGIQCKSRPHFKDKASSFDFFERTCLGPFSCGDGSGISEGDSKHSQPSSTQEPMGMFKQGCQVLIQGGGGIQGLQSKLEFLGTISENTQHQLSWINQEYVPLIN